ncbi:hypothetical protein [uncultured Corynebacterium sp.]|uniref:hypothetical protein n=1 Tax=uncultured Corynebacterium sp. TaxID=159447 RepID=UPI002617AC37|nr:hypothetical protein [uncultured Corynebacterium sp.]
MTKTDGPDLNARHTKNTPNQPRPSAYHGTDSAEVTPLAPQSTPPAPVEEPVVQFSTRLSFSCRQRVKQVANETGKTVRAVVEEAIIEKYGLPGEKR